MFSVAVKGYGIVIWDGDGEWRTFGATDSHSAMLAARVEAALATVPVPADDYSVREALLGIAGAGLLLRSYQQLLRIDLGYRTENVLTLRTALPGAAGAMISTRDSGLKSAAA